MQRDCTSSVYTVGRSSSYLSEWGGGGRRGEPRAPYRRTGANGGRGRSAALLFVVAVSLAVPLPTNATLTLERYTDVLGFRSTFEEGTGLPTRNFTMSSTVRSGATGGARTILLSARWCDIWPPP